MHPDTIVDVYCSICHEKIATARLGDLHPPMMGWMFKSPDEHHGWDPPFPSSVDWEWMRHLVCASRPFPYPDRLEISEPGGAKFTYYLPTEEQEEVEASITPALEDKAEMEASQDGPEEEDDGPRWEDTLLACDICGKTYNRIQMAIHKKNHKRSDRRREQRAQQE